MLGTFSGGNCSIHSDNFPDGSPYKKKIRLLSKKIMAFPYINQLD